MSEPDTISTVAGSELYQIPLSLCKRRGIGQWYYGKEAETVMKMAKEAAVTGSLAGHWQANRLPWKGKLMIR